MMANRPHLNRPSLNKPADQRKAMLRALTTEVRTSNYHDIRHAFWWQKDEEQAPQ